MQRREMGIDDQPLIEPRGELLKQTMPTKIYFVKGDVTEMAVDAIVNAANNDLVLGAGVAGAIRRKGGRRIEEECERIGRIAVGEAAVTTGGNLKALYVIHAASMRLGGHTTADSLRLATRNSLLRAEEKAIKSIAFPAIGTGVAGFPMEQCANIMIKEVFEHLRSRSSLEKIYFVLYDEAAFKIFEDTYKQLSARPATENV
jgi:O-acetyl-ADP-ribose deacetylase (regulator of RNase III)